MNPTSPVEKRADPASPSSSKGGGRSLLLSIRPRYARMILDGSKSVELRKTRPREIEEGSTAVIYVSSPRQAIVGYFSVREVSVAAPQKLWPQVEKQAGVTKGEFDAYYDGASRAVGIFIEQLVCLSTPLPLAHLRASWEGFRPPQSFRYLSRQQTKRIFS